MQGVLCFFHANPGKVRALGQAGGRKNRQRSVELSFESAKDLAGMREIIGQAVVDILGNRLSPRIGSALAQLANSLMRIIQVSEFDERLRKLEHGPEVEGSAGSENRPPLLLPVDRNRKP
jgi:hypothetical protein